MSDNSDVEKVYIKNDLLYVITKINGDTYNNTKILDISKILENSQTQNNQEQGIWQISFDNLKLNSKIKDNSLQQLEGARFMWNSKTFDICENQNNCVCNQDKSICKIKQPYSSITWEFKNVLDYKKIEFDPGINKIMVGSNNTNTNFEFIGEDIIEWSQGKVPFYDMFAINSLKQDHATNRYLRIKSEFSNYIFKNIKLYAGDPISNAKILIRITKNIDNKEVESLSQVNECFKDYTKQECAKIQTNLGQINIPTVQIDMRTYLTDGYKIAGTKVGEVLHFFYDLDQFIKIIQTKILEQLTLAEQSALKTSLNFSKIKQVYVGLVLEDEVENTSEISNIQIIDIQDQYEIPQTLEPVIQLEDDYGYTQTQEIYAYLTQSQEEISFMKLTGDLKENTKVYNAETGLIIGNINEFIKHTQKIALTLSDTQGQKQICVEYADRAKKTSENKKVCKTIIYDYTKPSIPEKFIQPKENQTFMPNETIIIKWDKEKIIDNFGLEEYLVLAYSLDDITYDIIVCEGKTPIDFELSLQEDTCFFRTNDLLENKNIRIKLIVEDKPGNTSELKSENIYISYSAKKEFETKPIAPSNFKGIVQSPTTILWTWKDNSENEQLFIIEDENQNKIAELSPNTTEFTEENLSPSTTYIRILKAYNNKGISYNTDEIFEQAKQMDYLTSTLSEYNLIKVYEQVRTPALLLKQANLQINEKYHNAILTEITGPSYISSNTKDTKDTKDKQNQEELFNKDFETMKNKDSKDHFEIYVLDNKFLNKKENTKLLEIIENKDYKTKYSLLDIDENISENINKEIIELKNEIIEIKDKYKDFSKQERNDYKDNLQEQIKELEKTKNIFQEKVNVFELIRKIYTIEQIKVNEKKFSKKVENPIQKIQTKQRLNQIK